MADEEQYLFVYGTLRKGAGHSMHSIIESCFEFVSDARVKGILFDMGEYPVAIPSTDSIFISGELYRIHEGCEHSAVWKQLDEYEGAVTSSGERVLFDRERVRVLMGAGAPVDAWIYWYNLPVTGLRVIESGDYVQYLRSKDFN